uniref:Uncharacterized protein n=1 Tax=Chenopodium quinoa TaxID=63459 RepID=A0A803MVQ9_CHEQI
MSNTPIHNVLSCVPEDGSTPARCVVESEEGVYEDLLDHPEPAMGMEICERVEEGDAKPEHQLKVYDVNDVTEVPSKYLLRCWRKDIHMRHTRVKVAYHDPTKTEEVKRYDKILTRFDSVCLKVATRPEYVKMAFEAISKLESYRASSPSVNNNGPNQVEEPIATMSRFVVESLGNLSAIGLEDISLDLEGLNDNTPLITMETPQLVSHNVSLVNVSPSVVGKVYFSRGSNIQEKTT